MIGGLIVDASVGIGRKFGGGGGGWKCLRPGSDAKFFIAELNSKHLSFIRSWDHHFSALILKENFCTEKPWWTGDGGCSVSTLLIAVCLKGRIMKTIIYFNCALTKTEKDIWSKGPLAIARKKGRKSHFFFCQNSTLLQVWAFDVFYLLDKYRECRSFHLNSCLKLKRQNCDNEA